MTNHYLGCKNAASASAKIEVYNDYSKEYVSRRFFADADYALKTFRSFPHSGQDKFYLKDLDTHKWVEVEVIC